MRTRKQLMKDIDHITESRRGHVTCRTCGVEGCCILDHDNLRASPQPTPIMPLAERYATRYDPGRDRFYGLEYDPYTGKTHDCRDRD